LSRRQFDATVLSASRQRWIDAIRDLLADLMSQLAGLIGDTGSIIGRRGGFNRRYPGGSACVRIFFNVRQ
jgi:hypothetical protein